MSSGSYQPDASVESRDDHATSLVGYLKVDSAVVRRDQPVQGVATLKSERSLPVRVLARCAAFYSYLSIQGLGDGAGPTNVRWWKGVAHPEGGQFVQKPVFTATDKGLEFQSPENVSVTFDCCNGVFPQEFYQGNPTEKEMLDSSYWRSASDRVTVGLQLEVKP